MIFTGREITAETAREWGLVNGVFTAGSLLEETLNLAEEIARRGWSPTLICESSGTQSEDALTMKAIYQEVSRS